MRIHGIDGMSQAEIDRQIAGGGRFVFYEICISFIALTARRPSDVYFLKPGNKGIARGVPYAVLSLLLGWWGLPWGLVYTPLVVLTDLTGGCDVTAHVRQALDPGAPSHLM
jgi:hypothetical protein